MANCLFCYQTVDSGEYHASCCKKFFGTGVAPSLHLDQERLAQLARLTVHERLSLTGVQPKISLSLEGTSSNRRLTIVGLWGDYILKPASTEYVMMPEVEDLTMHLAALFKIETAQHALVRTNTGDLAYITKRFDRLKGKKIHVEDLCQLSELLTEQKYKSSYERVGKIIRQYASNPGLDSIKYFRLVLFSFITGNNDMHLKNFSLMHTDKGILLSPAYDLLNINLIYPQDSEELALTLCARKRKLKRSDFDQFALHLHIPEKVRETIYKQFTTQMQAVEKLIQQSFLSDELKAGYRAIVMQKMKQIGLL